ncbi:hypothetical protein HMI56_006043 [Coelomomyces lativittatus]|nr:hypothetical protein HMI56_006043 [Coelomomyces lativittatus]
MDKQPLFFGDKSFQHLMGFVDQEDVLLPWLTVLESLWFVADTRLPESLKLDEKKRIIEEVMETLNISHIQHSKIGGAKAFRGISGGERRRVSVAMELITSPAILFLDEPTTGLDSHNAYKLMKCLADLSHQHHKTIVCTIHQPRHDVYALCDQIMLMSQGIILYQGPSHSAKSFLQSIGFPCPEHRHVSDHMIDLAMQPKLLQTLASTSPTHNSTSFDSFLTSYSDHSTNSSPESSRWKAKLNFLFHAFKLPKLSLPSFLKRKKQENLDSNTTSLLNSSSYMVSYVTQLNCLLLRSLKCLLRNKRLFLGHNMVAICLGCFMSLCYMYTTLTLEGFVNLVGIIVFLHLIITFSSFSTLHHMASDRLLFIRERGNHCYRPSTYFLSKLLMDLIPLRLLPTLWISSIVYFTCGFQVTYVLYFKFILVFLLYTSGVTLVCMIISVYFSDSTLANFTNSVTMLLFVLFSGIWVNLTQLTSALSWLQYLSLARWSSDALATSQLQMLKFETAWKDRKMMLEGTMFLKISFGFEIDSFVTKVSVLMGIDILLLFILGFSIVYKLKEIR